METNPGKVSGANRSEQNNNHEEHMAELSLSLLLELQVIWSPFQDFKHLIVHNY